MNEEEVQNDLQEVIDSLLECTESDTICKECEHMSECLKFIRVSTATSLMFIKRLLGSDEIPIAELDKKVKEVTSYFT